MNEHPTELSNITTTEIHFRWNDDYIELLSHRLELQKVRTLVDVGSGMGVLSGLFGLYMRPGSVVYGFDADAEAVRDAQARADAKPFSVEFRFAQARAEALPLADGGADLAICQHVLTQVPEPRRVLQEMMRVLRPGGRVVAFEPNRLVQSLVTHSLSSSDCLEDRLRIARYQAIYELGKKRMGLGDDSVGDLLPELFQEAGLERVEVRLSDKAAALVPPYDTEEKRARAREMLGWLSDYQENRPLMKECYLAGGGTEAEFEAHSAWELEQNEAICQAIRQERFVHPGGLLTYIVSGEKAR